MTKSHIDMNFTTRFRNFNWEKTRSFYIVAKSGSFSRASHILRLHQSALSRQIIDLEKALGVALFIREARGIRLTRKGEELYSIAEPMFLELTGFTSNIYAKTNKNKKRKIRISTTHAISTYILSEYIFSYNMNHSNLIFELIADDYIIDIVLNDVDIAIRPFGSKVSGVQQEHLFTLEKRLYASSEYLKKYGEPRTVEDLRNHHIIAHAHRDEYPYSDLNWILELGMPEGEKQEPVFTSNSLENLVKFAELGLGIIGCYQEMDIIKKSNLVNILPSIKDRKVSWDISYPDYLKGDKEILSLKKYLKTNLNKIS